MRRIARRAALAIGSMLSIIAALLAFPQPLFSHSMEHGQFKVWSDRPISPKIAEVLDDATRRMRTSEL